MKLRELHRQVAVRFAGSGIEGAEIEASQLLGHVLQMSRTRLLLAADKVVGKEQLALIEGLVNRRLAREPLAYILGNREFWSLSFLVTPDVLIPRPETEELLEHVLATLGKDAVGKKLDILDLGVGSGVISIVLALELPLSRVYGVDRSPDALVVAAANAGQHQVKRRIHYLCADWLSGLRLESRFDLVVSNPPYVARPTLAGLEPELAFEPRRALDGGEDGLVEIRRLVKELGQIIKPGGWFFMEIGFDQRQPLLDFFADLPQYTEVKVLDDYAGLPRIFQARLQP